MAAISGTSPIVIQPATFQWAAGTNPIEIQQAQNTSSGGTDMHRRSQAAKAGSGGSGGNIFDILGKPDVAQGSSTSLWKIQIETAALGATTDLASIDTNASLLLLPISPAPQIAFGKSVVSTNRSAMYFGVSGTAAFNTGNWAITGSTADTWINAPTTTIHMEIAGANTTEAATLTSSAWTLGVVTSQFNGAVASPVFTQAQATGTGAAAGNNLTAQAQQGQQQSGGSANNNGGNFNLSSGTPGTGGSGAAGLPGNVNLQVGATTQMQVGPNGLSFTRTSIALTNANVTLTQAQYQNIVVTLTGTLTASDSVTFPNVNGMWWVDVSGLSLSTFTLTYKCGTGAATAIASLGTNQTIHQVLCNGSNGIAVNL